MAFLDIVLPITIFSLGGILVGVGLWRLNRLDRERTDVIVQSNCKWHHWQAVEEGVWLVCRFCGKRSRRLNPREERVRETLPYFP